MFDEFEMEPSEYWDDVETWERDQLAMDEEDWDEYEDYDEVYGYIDYPEDF